MLWSGLRAVIEPYYPKAGNAPTDLERMLRIQFLQHWFKLGDLACKGALYRYRQQDGTGASGLGHDCQMLMTNFPYPITTTWK